ncbi:MAG: DNA repair protein RadA, partial [Bacteroidia bacterium]|nr:DNA repair protein RadA [Bacteroidia bacterium]
ATPDEQLNRVLGENGIVIGSVVLLAGEPGIGKSTVLLQLAATLKKKVLYISGEESQNQIRMRAERLGADNQHLFIAAETNMELVEEFVAQLKPDLLIIDSIQTIQTDELESAPGSVAQVRECTTRLVRVAKNPEAPIPVFLIGHINKEGNLAGPKVLEHIVDAVLVFSGEHHSNFRILRSIKNRFGANELGLYEMTSTGLRQVSNPSEIFLSDGDEDLSGVAIAATMEGQRPLLVEIQALVSGMAYGTAQRSSTGFDLRRLHMLLAVLEKRCGFKLSQKDVFTNVTGGLHLTDPAVDLALICALISSLHDLPISRKTVFAAEVGLSGEIRPVGKIEQRLVEAARLGFEEMFVSQTQAKALQQAYPTLKVRGVSKLDEVFRAVFGGE